MDRNAWDEKAERINRAVDADAGDGAYIGLPTRAVVGRW